MDKFEIIGLNTSGEKCLVVWKNKEIDLKKLTDAEAEKLVAEKFRFLKLKDVKAKPVAASKE